jgi:hypothetical protein
VNQYEDAKRKDELSHRAEGNSHNAEERGEEFTSSTKEAQDSAAKRALRAVATEQYGKRPRPLMARKAIKGIAGVEGVLVPRSAVSSAGPRAAPMWEARAEVDSPADLAECKEAGSASRTADQGPYICRS